LTDSRFPGTTELLRAASVELKGVRANLEEQVRKSFPEIGKVADLTVLVLEKYLFFWV